ncbi:hypothetical protein [Dyella nitratireducens]|uniref:Uncharacterized protein n=1 Tax=Dyella nitratireducens TaxID=1849580 RepID=A0ABQ1GAX4_9GAMM|nr:hypothetical protein [Dyella nitratireducens]GGA40191.1 hypothetical protein GCM10010981_31820 [Dyella nitratireducens]GLQ40540.1 hypothetical protein GCM10007902_03890 [Dyella nitratireducens]
MTTPKSLAKSEDSTPSNVVPFRPIRGNTRRLGAHPGGSWGVQTPTFEENAIEREPPEHRLARRIERVLGALLYHAMLESGDLRDSNCFSIDDRVNQLVTRDRLIAIAHAAIYLDLTADLTHLAATVIVFELQAQSQWWNRMQRPFSAHRRQINHDTLAIARLLAWDMDALKVRPIDKFAKFL